MIYRRFFAAVTLLSFLVLPLTAQTTPLPVRGRSVAQPESPADTTAQSLPFSQNWANTGLITANNDWSLIPGIIGYRGDGATASTGTDPQTITADLSSTPVNVIANQSAPNTLTTGGIAEFEIADPVLALQGSGTAASAEPRSKPEHYECYEYCRFL